MSSHSFPVSWQFSLLLCTLPTFFILVLYSPFAVVYVELQALVLLSMFSGFIFTTRKLFCCNRYQKSVFIFCLVFGSDALQCIMLPFATPISSVRLSMTSRSTAKTVRDRPMITMGNL